MKKQMQSETKLQGRENDGVAIRVSHPVIQYIKKEKRDSMPNHKSEFKTVEEEADARQAAVETQVMVFRRMLPTILKGISNIKDPRRKGSIRHKLRVMMLYGILMFVHQIASRRKVNDKMSKPEFVEYEDDIS